MRDYETLLLLSPEMTAEERNGVVSNLSSIVEREQGKMLNVDEWGMRDLAYHVKKQGRGYYIRLEYAAPGKAVEELERNIRITDGIFKFLTVKLSDQHQEA